MPTLVLEGVPLEVYERLQQRATARQRSLPEETLDLLVQALRVQDSITPRLPDFVPGEDVLPPCDLPRSSQPVRVTARPGEPRLPDPPLLFEQE